MHKVTSTLPETFTLEAVLDQLGVGFGMQIKRDQYQACYQAVLSAPDTRGEELRNWLSQQFVLDEITGEVRRAYAVSAWISYVQAEKAKKSGDTGAAWFYVSQVRFHEGQIDADFAAMERIDRFRRAGRKGGQTTGLKRSALMQECIVLLGTHRPEGGWKSHQQAFGSICAELLDFSARDGSLLSREDLLPKVMDWLAKHPEVQAAYEGDTREL